MITASPYGLRLGHRNVFVGCREVFSQTALCDFQFLKLAITTHGMAKLECEIRIGNRVFELGLIDTWPREPASKQSAYVHLFNDRVRRAETVTVYLTNHWKKLAVDAHVWAHGILIPEQFR